jgi:hypothetical protein
VGQYVVTATARPSTFNFAAGASLSGSLFTGDGTATVIFNPNASVAGSIQGGLLFGVASNRDTVDPIAKADSLTINLAPGVSAGSIQGSDGTNTVVGPNIPTTWTISGANIGTVAGIPFSFTNPFGGGVLFISASIGANLTGGTGIDNFDFQGTGSITGSLNGGAGSSNWLDYTAYSTTVTVDLSKGTATGVGSTLSNIQNVLGSNYGSMLTGNAVGNILVGGAGSDTITGGKGRSILIGGFGNDSLIAGSGTDILIGGTVNFGGNLEAALQAILNEWQRTDETYAQQMSNIRNGGGLNGGYTLVWGVTVLDDGGTNTFSGVSNSAAPDWIFANLAPGHDKNNLLYYTLD